MTKPYDPADYAPKGSKTKHDPEMLKDKVQMGLLISLMLWIFGGMSIVGDAVIWSAVFFPLLLVTVGRMVSKHWP